MRKLFLLHLRALEKLFMLHFSFFVADNNQWYLHVGFVLGKLVRRLCPKVTGFWPANMLRMSFATACPWIGTFDLQNFCMFFTSNFSPSFLSFCVFHRDCFCCLNHESYAFLKAFSDLAFLTSSGSAFHFLITLTLKQFLRTSSRTFSMYKTSLFLDSPSVVIVVVDLVFLVSSSFLKRNHEFLSTRFIPFRTL